MHVPRMQLNGSGVDVEVEVQDEAIAVDALVAAQALDTEPLKIHAQLYGDDERRQKDGRINRVRSWR